MNMDRFINYVKRNWLLIVVILLLIFLVGYAMRVAWKKPKANDRSEELKKIDSLELLVKSYEARQRVSIVKIDSLTSEIVREKSKRDSVMKFYSEIHENLMKMNADESINRLNDYLYEEGL